MVSDPFFDHLRSGYPIKKFPSNQAKFPLTGAALPPDRRLSLNLFDAAELCAGRAGIARFLLSGGGQRFPGEDLCLLHLAAIADRRRGRASAGILKTTECLLDDAILQ